LGPPAAPPTAPWVTPFLPYRERQASQACPRDLRRRGQAAGQVLVSTPLTILAVARVQCAHTPMAAPTTSPGQGYAAFSPRNQGFLGRHFRRISTSLPFSYAEKEKLGRGRFQGSKVAQILNRIGRNIWRLRKPVGLVLFLLLSFILFYVTRKLPTADLTWPPLT
jgi:hypothetical protein